MNGPRRGARLLLASTLVAQLSALLRYTLMARLLGPEQLGLAATVILIGVFFDSISDSGADRFLIQDRDGDEPRVQGLVQLMLGARGLCIAAALILFAGPLAAVYRAPELAAGVMLLAISPVILGFVHTDLARQQRSNDFRTEGYAMLAAETTSTAVTALAAWLTRDFTAVVWGLIARSAVTALISHLRAERGFRLAYAREHVRRLAWFAAPLMVNGLMLFLGQQGDRVLVSGQLGPTELGRYSVITLLAYYPTMTLLKYMGVIHLPRIAARRDDPASRNGAVDTLASQVLLLSVIMLAGFAIAAPIAVRLLFGAVYMQAGIIVALVGVLQIIRFMRLWPTTAALALGRSRTVMVTNIVRLAAFPLAIVAARFGGAIQGIIVGFIGGELLALAVGLVMVNRAAGRPLGHGFARVGLFLTAGVLLLGWEAAVSRPSTALIAPLAAASLALTAAIIAREREVIGAAWRHGLALLHRRTPALAPTRSLEL
jgi:O-antigen/teichoic acid export membrane protein